MQLHRIDKNSKTVRILLKFISKTWLLLKSSFVLRPQVAHVLIFVSCYRYPVAIFLLALGRVCVQEGKGNQNTAVATFVGKRRAVDRASIKSQKIESHTHISTLNAWHVQRVFSVNENYVGDASVYKATTTPYHLSNFYTTYQMQ